MLCDDPAVKEAELLALRTYAKSVDTRALSCVLCKPVICEIPGGSDSVTLLTPIGIHTVEDTSISDLLVHWIAEQQQRNDLCLRERPRIGILAARGHLRDGGWPAYGGDAPTVQAILEAGGFPCLIPTLPLIEGYDPLQLLSAALSGDLAGGARAGWTDFDRWR